MTLFALDHANVRTANLEAMVAWYDDVLGMKSGRRPDFGFPGAWLYVGENAAVHLVAVKDQPASVDPQIEHYAFRATGMDGFLEHLKSKGVEYYLAEVPGFGITQVNIKDPDGNHIHVDFETAEAG